ASSKLALVDGDVSDPGTATRILNAAVSRFTGIDLLVNNAGLFFAKRFLDYTIEDLRALLAVNIEGFVLVTQCAIRQMLAQESGGCVVNITSTLAGHSIAGVNVS